MRVIHRIGAGDYVAELHETRWQMRVRRIRLFLLHGLKGWNFEIDDGHRRIEVEQVLPWHWYDGLGRRIDMSRIRPIVRFERENLDT